MVEREHPTLSIARQPASEFAGSGCPGVERVQPLLQSKRGIRGRVVLNEGDGPRVPCDSLPRIETNESQAEPARYLGEPQAGTASMGLMGLQPLYRPSRTGRGAKEERIYAYLLRDVTVTRLKEVWVADITYSPMARGFLYLVAVMDYYSRCVLAWRLSNTLEPISASKRRWLRWCRESREYSILIRAASSPARSLTRLCGSVEWRSIWTGMEGARTTFWRSGCKGR